LGIITTFIVQDLFCSPSSVSVDHLRRMNWLPSSLSQFSLIEPAVEFNNDISPSTSAATQPIMVHYLKYKSNLQPSPSSDGNNVKFDAIYFNHGFGASSLSWLPSLTSITHKLNATLSLAHDAAGFGLTQRPYVTNDSFSKNKRRKKSNIIQYTSAVSAAIGTSLLSSHSGIIDTDKDVDNCPDTSIGNASLPSSIALFGHSMGCITTLRMALHLPNSTRKHIILVAPALFNQKSLTTSPTTTGLRKKILYPMQLFPVYKFVSLVKYLFIDLPFKYFLKRFVSQNKFWMKGLSAAWGDPNRVNDYTVLRYQWPSIISDWTEGLLSFTKAKVSGLDSYSGGDVKLLNDVVSAPNTSVYIIHGSKDRVIPLKNSKAFVKLFPQIPLVILDGMGHNPFEEDVEGFTLAVQDLICKSK